MGAESVSSLSLTRQDNFGGLPSPSSVTRPMSFNALGGFAAQF
jgi:hypothetical protein